MRKTPITFRRMSRKDIATARELWARSEGVELAEGDSRTDLVSYLQRNPGMSFVALFADVVIGAVLAGHDGRRGLLYHLAVEQKHQRAGIGEKLVRRSLGALKKSKIRRVLILVAHDNLGGKEFWRKLGFRAIADVDSLGLSL